MFQSRVYIHTCIEVCQCFLPLVYAVNVHMPRDRITQLHQSYGFVEFMGEEDADYAIKIMNMIKLYGKPIRVNKVQYKAWVTSLRLINHIPHNLLSISLVSRAHKTCCLCNSV